MGKKRSVAYGNFFFMNYIEVILFHILKEISFIDDTKHLLANEFRKFIGSKKVAYLSVQLAIYDTTTKCITQTKKRETNIYIYIYIYIYMSENITFNFHWFQKGTLITQCIPNRGIPRTPKLGMTVRTTKITIQLKTNLIKKKIQAHRFMNGHIVLYLCFSPIHYKTRTSAVQHKCLPHLGCINPTPLLF